MKVILRRPIFYIVGKCCALSYYIKTLRGITLWRIMKMLLAQPPQARSFASETLCSILADRNV